MMQRRLLSGTRPIQTLTTVISPPLLPSSPSHLLSRSAKHAPSAGDGGEPYDPPFSRVPKAPKPKRPPKTPTSGGDKPASPFHSELPFGFRYSYSEIDTSVKPIGFREPPRFSPFGPGRLDRKWDGVSAAANGEAAQKRVAEDGDSVLGPPLTEEEIAELVERYRHSDCSRQINLGRGGVTHNMLEDIHSHWKRADAVRIKCLGVPTIDMDNVCFHLECMCRIKQVERSYIEILTSFSYIVGTTMIPRKGQSYP